MLKMKCPSCHKEIVSPLLVELQTVVCPACAKNIPVEDIIVYANGFSYDRSQLRNRLSFYKDLLANAYKDREMLKINPDADATSQLRSERLVGTLEEIMGGARDRYRLKMLQDYFVTYQRNLLKGFALLLNLSTDGACMQSTTDKVLPEEKQDILLFLSVPGRSTPLALKGNVAWSKLPRLSQSNHQIGVCFTQIDDKTESCLRRFIEEKSAQLAS